MARHILAHGLLGLALAGLLSGCSLLDGNSNGSSGASDIDGEYLTTGGDGSNWASIGFNYDEARFSPLDQINAANVGELGLAWSVDLPDARGQEATPVVVDGKIYISTAWSKVYSYDALTGEELWSFDPEVDKAVGVNACCDVINRGVAVYQGKVFVAALDGRLIALDAGTGARLWSTQTTDKSKPYTITGAPRVVKDMVLIGNGGAEFGVRGYISAYDIDSGEQKWRFYTVPNPDGKPDGAASDAVMQSAAGRTWSENGEWKESGGGGTVWDAIVYDHELDQLYIGVGNGNPWNHGLRSEGEGDNLFLSSVVALKPDSGEYLWHYQSTPAETWDFTATQPIILADLNVEGQDRKVLMQAPKNGFFFVIDRTNGKMISAEPFIEGVNWATGYDKETGRPIENPAARFYKTGELFVALPSALGAHNWHPMSYNPGTGLVYIPAQVVAAGYLPPLNDFEKSRQSIGFNTGASNEGFVLPDDVNFIKAALSATKGQLVAYDPSKGKVAWTVDHETPWNGGTMTTAGGLVFQGTALGEMRAYDAKTGKQLWSYDTQSGVLGGVSTFLVDGEQYIAFLTSKGGAFPLVAGLGGGAANPVPNIPRLLVMKIGGDAKLPELEIAELPEWDIPEQFATVEQVASGRANFQRYCMVCHGADAVGGGVVPDLRRSGTLGSAELWDDIVHKGSLSQQGMVSFAPVLSAEEIQNIRGYVINRAEWGKETQGQFAGTKKNSAGGGASGASK
ncbi:PQQ-dependent dehydrogenase, methanol/ethanol family [Parasphingorhabdus sp. DH2-15]|uniref:PQQ-dependent dehydrogenase, methanol/ethanol family n=1 Tax=Parasphingorhabdus sp. DH2-15 TaxID=3444112 RepID=UPI003F6884BC